MARTKEFCEKKALEKAMELFWEKGFNGTSIQNLVDHLKINRASIYDTYGGKKELFNKAFKLYQEKQSERIWKFLETQVSVKKGLKNLFLLSVQETIHDNNYKGCFAANCTAELLPGDEETLNLLIKNENDFEKLLFNYLEKGQNRGEIDQNKDIKALASYLFTFYNGLQVIEKINHTECELNKIVNVGLEALN